MIIYLEKKYRENKIAQNIISKYKNAKILEIDNYKNIFDKNIASKTEKNIIIAWIKNSILNAPLWYGHAWKWYFLKNSLNCVFDCDYCYLKWAFKNEDLLVFVNYDDIKTKVLENDKYSKSKIKDRYYSSDYSDNLAIDNLSNFSLEFIPFFDTLKNSMLEIRTKSVNISNLLKLKASKNVEICFSLNPSELISKYENKTSSLEMRIKAINTLIDAWWQVGIRFLPLLEVDNYKEIYKSFLEDLISKIDFDKIYSVFIGWLLYTKSDYKKILNKKPYLDLLYKLDDSKDWFYREKREVRDFFYNLFDEILEKNKCNRCLDN